MVVLKKRIPKVARAGAGVPGVGMHSRHATLDIDGL